MRKFELRGLTNRWEASKVGHVPVTPSYKSAPMPCLARLCWGERRASWVPATANRWNRHFVLVTVTPDPADRRSEELLWLHHTDVAWVVPAEPSTAPPPPPRAPAYADIERRYGPWE